MSDHENDEFRTYVQDRALWVVFDRPEARNALTTQMYDGLREACLRTDSDDSIRCLVIGGAANDRRSFAAGSDIAAVAAFSSWEEYRAYEDGIGELIRMIQGLQVPTIAAVAGPCVGAGATLALACDLRVVAESAGLGYPMARTTGGCLPTSTYVLLASHVGASRALDLLLTARLLGASEMESAGLTSSVVNDTDLDRVVRELAERISRHAPLSMAAAKTEILRLREQLSEGGTDDLRRAVFESADYREGLDAFMGRRTPVWSGR